ncbi:hypothetical protein [Methylobacterium persicinum]|uniref:SGNH hydrolase-type esterase domain-containing protein n=1 Tax=Methylobacterium persicinum TaxID=374426 RepID=A0ABU0HSL5_9HYPH|nr:hypothetical protein [Methylobacterium persicinum]MDQ0445329.1 hypothetical protein [Methylobacterium persicinum]GJE39782.1 hypothetical protein KHHGKMAE_3868 [Methylobacterium persicinum]
MSVYKRLELTMITGKTLRGALLLMGLCIGSGAQASCMVVGDSIGVGIGAALKGVCQSSAKVGISSIAVAERVRAGAHWTIASLGSNDFPRGIGAAQRSQSEARVRSALVSASAKAGDHLILVLPANGARGIVQSWASLKGVRTVSFSPGPDGIHPRNYNALGREIQSRISD